MNGAAFGTGLSDLQYEVRSRIACCSVGAFWQGWTLQTSYKHDFNPFFPHYTVLKSQVSITLY